MTMLKRTQRRKGDVDVEGTNESESEVETTASSTPPPTDPLVPLQPQDLDTSPPVDEKPFPTLTPEEQQSVADRVNRALDDPDVRQLLLDHALGVESTRKGPKFDINNNRTTIELPGAIIPKLEAQWHAHNSTLLPGDRMDFSKFLAMRIWRCLDHTDERFGYLTGDQLRRIEQIADENFVDGQSILHWIERTRILHYKDTQGESLTFDPLPPLVLTLLSDRLYDGETLIHLVNRIFQKAAHEYVNVDYLEPWS